MSRTIVDIRDDLLKKAQRLTGLTKKVELVNLALEYLIRQIKIEEILTLKGHVQWSGNLRKMRRKWAVYPFSTQI